MIENTTGKKQTSASHEDVDQSSTAERILQVLEVTTASPTPLSMDGIISRSGVAKATAYRLVESLCRAGMLLREPRGRGYSPGPRLSALGLTLISNGSFRTERQSILQSLVAQIGETCNFTTLHNNEVVYVERVECSWPLKLELRPGSIVPLHCTSTGKLYLSLMTAAQRSRLLRSAPIQRYTPHTIVDPDTLEAELRHIRKSRVSTDREGYLAGLISVAVPVYGPDRKVIGAVSVHALAARLSLERALTFVPQIRRAAVEIGEAYRKLTRAATNGT